ncbi:MAG: cytochrome P450 [Acidimicrobiales bacterium]|nr:cytochrome P450 [Acidimicrobiales bacterium]
MTAHPTAPDAPAFELRSGESWRDPFPMYRALRDHDPVHRVEANGQTGSFWFLSRFEDVFTAVRDTDTFSSAHGLTVDPDAPGTQMGDATPIVFMDPPDHTTMRRLVSAGFTPRQVTELEDEIRAFVVEHLERLRMAGSGDIISGLFKPLPSFVVAHYLGVPPEDRTRFDGWTEQIVAAAAQGNIGATEGIADLLAYFSELIERRRTDPGDDMVSHLVQLGEDDVSLLWVLGFAFTMVTGGNDTATGLLGGSAVLLTEHRDERRRLLEEPDLLPGAVEELLRLTSPVQGLARTATRDIEVGDTTIPAGDKVLLGYGAANRDEREFGPDAEALDVGRDVARHLTFGYGAHHCLGASAARLQARIALEELLTRCPDFTVDAAAGEYATGNYVRRHVSLPFSTRS